MNYHAIGVRPEIVLFVVKYDSDMLFLTISDQKEGLDDANNMKEGEKDDGTTTSSTTTPFSMESSTSRNKSSGNSKLINTYTAEGTIQDKSEGVVVGFTEMKS